MVKVIALFFLLFILALIQTSFLPHFGFNGFSPNLILIAVVIVSFFEKPAGNAGFTSAFLGGLLSDIFSGKFFGFWIVIMLASAIFIKYLLRSYFYFHVKIFRQSKTLF
ncbi:MAG: rod shape-determining protein MreD [bacterium]|nr:rod shape-determining protein MreD [bacterium]